MYNPYRYLDVPTLQTKLAAYNAAEAAILTSQSYSMDGVSLSRANLDSVQKAIGLLSQALRLRTGQAVTRAVAVTTPGGRAGYGC